MTKFEMSPPVQWLEDGFDRWDPDDDDHDDVTTRHMIDLFDDYTEVENYPSGDGGMWSDPANTANHDLDDHSIAMMRSIEQAGARARVDVRYGAGWSPLGYTTDEPTPAMNVQAVLAQLRAHVERQAVQVASDSDERPVREAPRSDGPRRQYLGSDRRADHSHSTQDRS